MSFEDAIAADNSNIFLTEFTFSSTLFKNDEGQELELCDGAVWIDDLLLLFQLKERNPDHDTRDPVKEQRWFERKVEKVAVGQFNDTQRYLREQNSLPFTNRRGQTLELAEAKPKQIHLIVLFDSSDSLPIDVKTRKGRVSGRVGFVHYFHRNDYGAVCKTLHTPFEIAEYLDFRMTFVLRNKQAHCVREKALLGKYLTDTDELDDITDEHEIFVDRLVDDRNDFNLSGLLKGYFDSIQYGNEGTQYHAILKELAKLQRNMLREFRKRLEWSMDKCHEATLPLPSRFYPVKQDCGFIAIPLPTRNCADWQKHLEAYTLLCKYDLKATRCLGFTTAVDNVGLDEYRIHWLLLDYEWSHDANLEAILADGGLFRESTGQLIGKYNLR